MRARRATTMGKHQTEQFVKNRVSSPLGDWKKELFGPGSLGGTQTDLLCVPWPDLVGQ